MTIDPKILEAAEGLRRHRGSVLNFRPDLFDDERECEIDVCQGGEVLIGDSAGDRSEYPCPECVSRDIHKAWYYVATQMVEAVEEVRKSDKEADL